MWQGLGTYGPMDPPEITLVNWRVVGFSTPQRGRGPQLLERPYRPDGEGLCDIGLLYNTKQAIGITQHLLSSCNLKHQHRLQFAVALD